MFTFQPFRSIFLSFKEKRYIFNHESEESSNAQRIRLNQEQQNSLRQKYLKMKLESAQTGTGKEKQTIDETHKKIGSLLQENQSEKTSQLDTTESQLTSHSSSKNLKSQKNVPPRKPKPEEMAQQFSKEDIERHLKKKKTRDEATSF